jgi:hypothetical protein
MEYYNKNIQLDKNVIIDIISEYKSDYKMLIFGLGYDSKLWYNLTNNNTYFIEDNQKWIDFNKDIDNKNKIKYKYLNLNFKEIAHNKKIENYINNILKNLEVNDDLINLGKFDIILIDGPAGYSKEYPGRIIPCYLSKKYFSKKNTLIYIDDSKRIIEKFCINNFFKNNVIKTFKDRNECVKIKIF